MTDIRGHLSRLGLAQYAEQFIEEGFESWETVLHITESDLDHLKVKLGHRRILQKEIALARGITVENLSNLNSPLQPVPIEDTRAYVQSDTLRLENQQDIVPRGKRKYRRHPKQDENAPERPPSAYVLFSNKIREELKPLNLSFTEIAKRVGEKWQALGPEEKGPYESSAMQMKEKYHQELTAYKTTDDYRSYMEYLADFKAKNSSSTDGKRPRLEQQESTGSSNTMPSGTEGPDSRQGSIAQPRQRLDSMSSVGAFPTGSGISSPASATGAPPRIGAAALSPFSNPSPSSMSPSSPPIRRDSSISSRPSSILQPRPFIEPSADPAASSVLSQRRQRESPYSRSGSSSSTVDARFPYNPDSQASHRSSSARAPSLLHHNTSSSSGLSSGSQFSSSSTAPSLYTMRSNDDESRPQLPPLSASGFKPSGAPNLADYSLRKSQTPESVTPPGAHQPHIPPSQFSPPPLSSDIPPRASLRNLTLQQTAGEQRFPPDLSQPRDPPPPPASHQTLPSIGSASLLPPGHQGQAQEGDRLALLADIAHANRDAVSRPPS